MKNWRRGRYEGHVLCNWDPASSTN